MYYFLKKQKFKKTQKNPFLVEFFRWVFLGFFGWVFLGVFFNANPGERGVGQLFFLDERSLIVGECGLLVNMASV